jgi:hypothetical protein
MVTTCSGNLLQRVGALGVDEVDAFHREHDPFEPARRAHVDLAQAIVGR